MCTRNSSFFQRSKRVAEEFLKTVVLVDDLASFEEKRAPSKPIEPIELIDEVVSWLLMINQGRQAGKQKA